MQSYNLLNDEDFLMDSPVTIKKVRASSFLVVELEGISNMTLRRYRPRAWEWAETIKTGDDTSSLVSFRPVVDSLMIQALEEKIHEYLSAPVDKSEKRRAVYDSYKESV